MTGKSGTRWLPEIGYDSIVLIPSGSIGGKDQNQR